MILIVNNSESAIPNKYQLTLRTCLDKLGVSYRVCSNMSDLMSIMQRHPIHGCILSGSTRLLSEPIRLMDIQPALFVLNHLSIPVLGICFGSQLMTMLSGGYLQSLGSYRCLNLPIETLSHPLFADVDKNTHVRFCFSEQIHIDSTFLQPIAWSMDGNVCAFTHPTRQWLGCLFHPEFTPIVIRNFISICDKSFF